MRKTFQEFRGKKKYHEFTEKLAELTKGYADLMQVGAIDEYQIFKVVINPNAKRTIIFLAGLHGDEPAPCWGVLKFLETKFHIPSDLRIVILPLCNPVGFIKGIRQNAKGDDINRQFFNDDLSGEAKAIHDAVEDEKAIFLCTLHEDPSLHSFYLYYTKHKELAEDLRSLAQKYFSIYGKDKRDPIDGEKQELYNDKVYDGLIPLPHTRRGGIEDIIYEKGVPYITTETPGKALLKDRVDFVAKAIRMVIHAF